MGSSIGKAGGKIVGKVGGKAIGRGTKAGSRVGRHVTTTATCCDSGCCGEKTNEVQDHLEYVVMDGEELIEMLKDQELVASPSPIKNKDATTPKPEPYPIVEYIDTLNHAIVLARSQIEKPMTAKEHYQVWVESRLMKKLKRIVRQLEDGNNDCRDWVSQGSGWKEIGFYRLFHHRVRIRVKGEG